MIHPQWEPNTHERRSLESVFNVIITNCEGELVVPLLHTLIRTYLSLSPENRKGTVTASIARVV